MSPEHWCQWCAGQERGIRETRDEIAHCLRIMAKAPGTARAKGQVTRIATLKARIRDNQAVLATHRAEVAS